MGSNGVKLHRPFTVIGDEQATLSEPQAVDEQVYRCIGGAKRDTVAECKALIAEGGAKVHVSGTLTECTATLAEVTASEVKIQKD